MTCSRKGACAGARTFGAQGAQNAGTCQREHGRFSAVHRQCPGILRTRSKFLHVIAWSEATWQSVTPAAVHGRKQRLRQIRKASQICPNSSQLAKFPCGENGLPRQCAHWLAMTCRRKGACAGARTFGAQGAQNAGTCQWVQGRFPAVHRQCPGILRTRSKCLHVIARSGATWQSVFPAVGHGGGQYFGRIRKVLRICPK